MRVILPMPGNEAMAGALAERLDAELGLLDWRRFPDAEAYVRIASDVQGKRVHIVCTLANPDPQILTLIFAAAAARECGAESVHLIAPYLAYMRQDMGFKSGEAVSAIHFARLLSQNFDSLATIDPHLHRVSGLGKIFSIPTCVCSAAPLLGDWIAQNVDAPLIIGPDQESEQWAAEVAQRARAPHVVASKHRIGDEQVRVELPDLALWSDRRPVLTDDIISSGRTMMEASSLLIARGMAKPYCLAIHAVFAAGAFDILAQLTERVVTTDTIAHSSNAISVVETLARLIESWRIQRSPGDRESGPTGNGQ
ncbi:MAG: ribose-phosphate diphosphokinase [Parvularculaceae bacterium]